MIAVIEEAKELFLDVEHPEGTVLRLDPVVDQNTGETQICISAGGPQAGDQGIGKRPSGPSQTFLHRAHSR